MTGHAFFNYSPHTLTEQRAFIIRINSLNSLEGIYFLLQVR